jgi:dihydrodipicolinate synthase/N-acetylneuraminate lyase
MLTTARIRETLRPNRKVEGISAVLLPFRADGGIDIEGFRTLLRRTFAAGIAPAVNMDTGYANLISDAERRSLLEITRDEAAGKTFVAGAYVQGKPGDAMAHYRQQIEEIQAVGGTPIIFQSDHVKQLDAAGVVRFYQEIGRIAPRFIGFELGEMFVPFGRIYDADTFRALLDIPQLIGAKHSSLNRELEWERLALRDLHRPDFKVYTGNDLAIDLVFWGSDYLLGLSAFHPEAFALRDRLWEVGDSRAYGLNDLIQYLGFFAFRAPVPAYKHSAAQFLHLRGLIATDRTHPQAATRPVSDVPILAEILHRLDTMVADLSNS